MATLSGPARLGRRTKDLVKRLQPGAVAVLEHRDLDRVSAEELVAAGVVAVVNTRESSSGRFPNPGPLRLVRGGVALLDVVDVPLFEVLSEGQPLTVRNDELWAGGQLVARGCRLDAQTLERRLDEQRTRLTDALEAFAGNTLSRLQEEGRQLAGDIEFPTLRTRFRGRHAVVIARGPGYKDDLRIVRPYIRDFKPVLVAVDGGADALLEFGFQPDVIIGDFDSVSDRALATGAELLVHAYADGRAPGAARLEALALAYTPVVAPGISEDIALQLAHDRGAELIVAVGTHFNLVEFLERDRAGMASTFVTRLKVGEVLVDAKGVSRLVSPRLGPGLLTGFVATGIGTMAIAVAVSPALRNVVSGLGRALARSVGL
ncbi:MAG: putative cytokinetic ring protein SteA [Gaiella sp.]